MTMTSRDRVMTALNRKEPDHVPFCDVAVDKGLAQKLLNWQGDADIGSSSRTENPYTVEESKAISACLGLDNISYLLRAPTYAHMHKGIDGRTFVGAGMIKTETDLSMIDLPDPYDDALYREAEEYIAGREDYAACFVTRIGFFQVVLSLGLEGFSMALYDKTAMVEKMLDMYFDWMTVVAERVCKIGFDVFWTTDDFAHKSGLMFAPKVFEELLVPRYRKVLEKVTIPWVLHSDGDITEVMDLFIDLGVTGFHPIERGAMDIASVKKAYGDRVCLLGNVDLNILGAGTPEETDEEVKYLIRNVAPGGGYIVTSGNSLASYLDPECVMAMSKAVKKYGRYPIEI
jgi:uroporphyrinogen decarboxylase